MKKFSIYLGALFLLLSIGTLRAQTTITYTTNNELGSSTYDLRLLNHYNVDELDQMKVNSPEKYQQIVYYYTQSYSLQIIECFECTPIDPAKFDVSIYENLRKIDETRVFENKKLGFILTLPPIDKLVYKLPIHLAKLEYN